MTQVAPPSLHSVNLLDLNRVWTEWKIDSHGRRLSSADLNEISSVVCLGPPGIGKTAEMWQLHLGTADSVWVDLGLVDPAELRHKLLSREGTVFVDGCDEFTGAAGPLFAALRSVVEAGLRLRIGARSAWWLSNEDLVDQLGSVTTAELMPLDARGAKALLSAEPNGLQVLEAVEAAGLERFGGNPRMLVTLARGNFGEELASDRSLLYQQFVLAAATERVMTRSCGSRI